MPEPGEVWRHHRGACYCVQALYNEMAEDHAIYPVMVGYHPKDKPTVLWCRPLPEFLHSFKLHRTDNE